jgi:hypothetical protein
MTAYLIVACIAGGFLCFHDLHDQRSPPSLGLLGRGRVAGAALVARDDHSFMSPKACHQPCGSSRTYLALLSARQVGERQCACRGVLFDCALVGGLQGACREPAGVPGGRPGVSRASRGRQRRLSWERQRLSWLWSQCVWGGGVEGEKGKEKGASVSKLAPKLSSRDDLQHHDSSCNTARRLRRSSEALLGKPMTPLKPMRDCK